MYSIASIGALCGTFIFSFMSKPIGSKRAMTYLAFPAIIHWILIRFGNTIHYLLCARFFTGLIIGGMYSVIAVYVSEISNDSIRGRLGSIQPLSRNIGLLAGYIGGALFEYNVRPYIFIVFPVIYLILMHSLPNTPQYYISKQDFEVSNFLKLLHVNSYFLFTELTENKNSSRKQKKH